MVREAAGRILPLARRTPVMTSRSIDSRAGFPVFFKCENLQRGGAFKIRGASNLVLSIPPADLPRGVVAFSSGNHAQATAIAAKHVGALFQLHPRREPMIPSEIGTSHGLRARFKHTVF